MPGAALPYPGIQMQKGRGSQNAKRKPDLFSQVGFLMSYPTKIDTAVAGVLSAAYVFWGFEKSVTMVIYALSKISDC